MQVYTITQGYKMSTKTENGLKFTTGMLFRFYIVLSITNKLELTLKSIHKFIKSI